MAELVILGKEGTLQYTIYDIPVTFGKFKMAATGKGIFLFCRVLAKFVKEYAINLITHTDLPSSFISLS